ncbi:SixA phosphatase family protein [Actinokineospora guangxiensis]|uniref:SixA phosphatase family protein n=1 Tax=Actinokineospora guangxiensis TaxID=1490288 RepID=A0ABW0ETL3_9PSEU
MRLVLLRHAKSAWPPDVPDTERPLNDRGRRDAPAVGRWLAGQPGFDLALVSPATRARQTWALVSAELAEPPEHRIEPALYFSGPREIIAAARETGLDDVLVVAHNPDLEDVVAELTGERVTLKTSALAVVDTDAGALRDVRTLRGAAQ